MRKIPLWVLMLVLTASLGRAQDTATQQQLDKLSGQIQDLTDAQVQQGKRLDAIEKEIADLSDKMNQPAANNYASADDLKKLAEQVQEIDQKRQDDRDLILKQLEKLGKISASTSHRSSSETTPPADTDNAAPAPVGPQTGHPYIIASGDTLAAIAKAYRAQGVKVSVKDILAANPGLDPNKLYVGKKIFIPDPSAK
ncbi:MAG: LysM peptidoglycan-binding domain-containing protein [Verrucomicrobiota bacterium]